MVGRAGFEPATSRTQSASSDRAELSPYQLTLIYVKDLRLFPSPVFFTEPSAAQDGLEPSASSSRGWRSAD